MKVQIAMSVGFILPETDKAGTMICVNARGDVFLQEICLGKAGVSVCRAGHARCALRGAVVSTDRLSGYIKVLAEIGVCMHGRFASSGSHVPLNRGNALHSALSHFFAPFRGALLDQLGIGSRVRTWHSYAETPYPFHPELNKQMSLAVLRSHLQ